MLLHVQTFCSLHSYAAFASYVPRILARVSSTIRFSARSNTESTANYPIGNYYVCHDFGVKTFLNTIQLNAEGGEVECAQTNL